MRRKSSDGIINLIIFLTPVFLGMFYEFAREGVPIHIELGILLIAVGFLLFVISKMPVLSWKNLFTFGPTGMTRRSRFFYFSGYLTMILGIAFLMGVHVL